MEPGVDVCGTGVQYPLPFGVPSRLKDACAAVDVELRAPHRGRRGPRNDLCHVRDALDIGATHRGLEGGAVLDVATEAGDADTTSVVRVRCLFRQTHDWNCSQRIAARRHRRCHASQTLTFPRGGDAAQ
jgi:hypothetical protein